MPLVALDCCLSPARTTRATLFATHLLAAGLSPHAVAALLGHSDAGLVLRRYGHALPDEVAQAGVVLSAWRAARGG